MKNENYAGLVFGDRGAQTERVMNAPFSPSFIRNVVR